MVSTWGLSDNIMVIDANSYLYEKASSTPFNNVQQPYQNEFNYQALPRVKYGKSQVEQIFYCKTMFTIKNNKVVNYSFIGDDCV